MAQERDVRGKDHSRVSQGVFSPVSTRRAASTNWGTIAAPFYILVSSFLLFWIAGFAGAVFVWPWPAALRAALATMFLVTASAHWGKKRTDLIRMVPPAFPKPEFLVTATGCFEIAGAIGLLLPATTRLVATCLALLMVAMFPANVLRIASDADDRC